VASERGQTENQVNTIPGGNLKGLVDLKSATGAVERDAAAGVRGGDCGGPQRDVKVTILTGKRKTREESNVNSLRAGIREGANRCGLGREKGQGKLGPHMGEGKKQ